ncbi:MAG: porin [Anaeromyxobacter sp.]
MKKTRTLPLAAAAALALLGGRAQAQSEQSQPVAPAPPPAAAQPAPAAPAPAPAPVTAPAAAKPASKGPQLYGFVQLQLSQLKPPSPAHDSSTFEVRRARLGARGDLTGQIGYAAIYDFADSSLKDAVIAGKNLGWAPGVELRFGQFKTPFGWEQPESDYKLLWVYSSYVVQALARSTTTSSVTATPDARDIGAQLLGKWGGPALTGELTAAVTNGAGPNRKDDLDRKNLWGRAGLAGKLGPVSLRGGVSYAHGRQLAGLGANAKFDGVGTFTDDTFFDFDTVGGDVELDSKWLFVAAEYIQSDRDQSVYAAGVATETSYKARGWYAGAYGKTPWRVGPVVRVEQYDRNRSTDDDTAERYTLGLYYDLDQVPVNTRLIFNYELDQSDDGVKVGDRAVLLGQVIF